MATLVQKRSVDFVATGTEDVVVRSTANYDQFVYDPRNRPIDWGHVQELFDSVFEKNLLADYPIVVESRAGHLIVLDGQHRLEVAKILEVPIFYVVSDAMRFEDVHRVNTATQKWDNYDYLNRWLREGKLEYVKFKNYVEKYPHIGFNFAISTLMVGSNGVVRQAFRNGTYVCDNLEVAERLGEAAKSLEPYAKGFSTSVHFMVALRELLSNPRFDLSVLLKKLEYQSVKMRKQPDSASYVQMILEIMNFRNRGPLLTMDGVSYRK